ncbi:MAG: HAD family hydrolase [Ignavibacteriales bacterium]|nr:HAD family hydrolase [Ignavibacteriales bacterium]MCF8435434.1 HAD family hydrolase [Ignavibacteriales bacterium]
MSYRALFLDRDGTINKDPGYIKDPSEVELLPFVGEGLLKIKERLNFKAVVISNQSGISRGLMTHEDVLAVNNRINTLLLMNGTSVDAFYYCPYHPDYDDLSKTICRKPNTYMVELAAAEMGISLKDSVFIGDKATDIECGFRSGLKTILVNDISGEEFLHLKKINILPNFVAVNFESATDYILKEFNGVF